MSYRRKIVGVAKREQEFVHVKSAKSHRYSDEVKGSVTYRVTYGWRLSCGHVMSGEKGHKKQSVDCYYCEWMERETDQYVKYAIENSTEWTDVSGHEAERLQAQS